MNGTIKLSSPLTHEFWEIPVLFEDDNLLALDKPSDLLTSPDRDEPTRPSLIQLLHAAIADKKPWATERSLSYLMNAHRLEPETSGVLLLAKSKAILVALANMFSSEKAIKSFTSLVHGNSAEDEFEVDAAIAPDTNRPGVMKVDTRAGKRALTLFKVQERFSRWTLFKCTPLTPRTHQIRLHCRYKGHPIVGDTLYGGKPLWLSAIKPDYRLKPGKTERPLLSRVALHAEELQLPHPTSGQPLKITAPWPKDLKVAVKYLRQYAATR
jgi:RluA family pseudouridine synthase